MFARLAVLALFAVAVPPVVGADDKGTTRVTGTVIVPKEVPSFDNRVVELRLYSVNKNIADKGADPVPLDEQAREDMAADKPCGPGESNGHGYGWHRLFAC